MSDVARVRVVDSHSGGEPTHVVLKGGPDLGAGTAAERLERLRRDHDDFRSAIVNEPRGFDALVGALLGEPVNPEALAQVIFFNNVGYLGMCVHGTIGVAATLSWLRRIEPGLHLLETPVGDVEFVLDEGGNVAVQNVPSFRTHAGLAVDTPNHGRLTGDIAWGGNWFFLIDTPEADLRLGNLDVLTALAQEAREAVAAAGITGSDGAEIDHVELFGPPHSDAADSRNFVLCPGREYDRSPCGTGTSAKLACLHADGKFAPGERWRQESITGSVFVGSIEVGDTGVVPTVAGRAWVTGESVLVLCDDDPLRAGIRPT